MNSLLGTDSSDSLLKEVKAHEQWGGKKLERLVETFIDNQEALNVPRLGLGESQKTATSLLEKIIVDQQHLLDQFRQGDSKKVFSNKDLRSHHVSEIDRFLPSSLTNPERVERLLGELEKFYQKFQEILALPKEEVVKKIHDFELVSELRVTSAKGLGLGPDGVINYYVAFDYRAFIALRDSNFEEVKKRLQKEQQTLEKKKDQLKKKKNKKN